MTTRRPRRSSDPDQLDLLDIPEATAVMLTYSGRTLDLEQPDFSRFEIEDIAHGLARVARWNGQTHGAHSFSVAQHSLLVEAIASHLNPDWSDGWRLMALLHDAPEYVIGDMISPFKLVMGDAYKDVENRLLGAIHLRFGLPPQTPAAPVVPAHAPGALRLPLTVVGQDR